MTFRISSLEPMDCSDALVDLVARQRPVRARTFTCRCSTRATVLLTAMRRPYTFDAYRRLVDRIRARMPHAFIGSDVIVGFPGETEAEHRSTPPTSCRACL